MTPEQWRRVFALVRANHSENESQRPSFLRANCADDKEVLEAAQSLLLQMGASFEHPFDQHTAASPAESVDLGPEQTDLRFPRGSAFGRYMVLDLLGKGGMGVVFAAYDPELDRKVAIKVISPEWSQRGEGTDGGATLAIGAAHRGHAAARSDTSQPQSRHLMSAKCPPPRSPDLAQMCSIGESRGRTQTEAAFLSWCYAAAARANSTSTRATQGRESTMRIRTWSDGIPLFWLLTFAPLLAAKAQDVDVAGNLTMHDSTDVTVGNVLKEGVPFLHNFGTNNTFLGTVAGNFTMTGSENTGNGVGALFTNSSGTANTATGFGALGNNDTGSRNTASGRTALFSNTSGTENTATGHAALFNATGNFNTASGANALRSNTTGTENTANGAGALTSNTTGVFNTASGTNALFSNITGHRNTAIGWDALFSNTTGVDNTAVGVAALSVNEEVPILPLGAGRY